MPSFLLNGAGGYVVTASGDRIIVATDDELFDTQHGRPAPPRWRGRSASPRWSGELSTGWHARPASPIWEGNPQ